MAQADHVINALRAWNTGAIANPSTSPVVELAEYAVARAALASGAALLPPVPVATSANLQSGAPAKGGPPARSCLLAPPALAKT